MHVERAAGEKRTRARPRWPIAALVVVTIIVGLAIWFDSAIDCGPETADDTAGLCQGPSPTSPWD